MGLDRAPVDSMWAEDRRGLVLSLEQSTIRGLMGKDVERNPLVYGSQEKELSRKTQKEEA
jgi:hypothetical protein